MVTAVRERFQQEHISDVPFLPISLEADLRFEGIHSVSRGQDQVEIRVAHCGICHSDLSMLENEWGMSQFPLIAGHEAVGTVLALGPNAQGLKVGSASVWDGRLPVVFPVANACPAITIFALKAKALSSGDTEALPTACALNGLGCARSRKRSI